MQKRIGIFETNSSSTHSVSIDTGFDYVMPESIGEIIVIEPGEFGWEQERYDDFSSRASYAYTYAKNYGRKKDLMDLINVIESFTGSKVEFEKNEDDFYENGYIDHQSVDEAEIIFKNKETIKKFLFGRKSYFKTDNDNR